jgi:Na+/phosphate symporter
MTTDEQTPATSSQLMHETIDQLSTIISIAQFSMLNDELSPKLKEDLQRVVQAARGAAENLRQLGDMLHEGE